MDSDSEYVMVVYDSTRFDLTSQGDPGTNYIKTP